MQGTRLVALMLLLGGLALATVALRAEQARVAATTLRLESRWVELRRERWSVHAHLARLRTPAQLRERAELFKVGPVAVAN